MAIVIRNLWLKVFVKQQPVVLYLVIEVPWGRKLNIQVSLISFQLTMDLFHHTRLNKLA